MILQTQLKCHTDALLLGARQVTAGFGALCTTSTTTEGPDSGASKCPPFYPSNPSKALRRMRSDWGRSALYCTVTFILQQEHLL